MLKDPAPLRKVPVGKIQAIKIIIGVALSRNKSNSQLSGLLKYPTKSLVCVQNLYLLTNNHLNLECSITFEFF